MHFCTTKLKDETFDNFLQYIEIRERLLVKFKPLLLLWFCVWSRDIIGILHS